VTNDAPIELSITPTIQAQNGTILNGITGQLQDSDNLQRASNDIGSDSTVSSQSIIMPIAIGVGGGLLFGGILLGVYFKRRHKKLDVAEVGIEKLDDVIYTHINPQASQKQHAVILNREKFDVEQLPNIPQRSTEYSRGAYHSPNTYEYKPVGFHTKERNSLTKLMASTQNPIVQSKRNIMVDDIMVKRHKFTPIKKTMTQVMTQVTVHDAQRGDAGEAMKQLEQFEANGAMNFYKNMAVGNPLKGNRSSVKYRNSVRITQSE
jgi:hypothetical protein